MEKSYEELLVNYVRLLTLVTKNKGELRALRLLRKNLESGVIMRVSKDLVKLLMERDWTNG